MPSRLFARLCVVSLVVVTVTLRDSVPSFRWGFILVTFMMAFIPLMTFAAYDTKQAFAYTHTHTHTHTHTERLYDALLMSGENKRSADGKLYLETDLIVSFQWLVVEFSVYSFSVYFYLSAASSTMNMLRRLKLFLFGTVTSLSLSLSLSLFRVSIIDGDGQGFSFIFIGNCGDLLRHGSAATNFFLFSSFLGTMLVFIGTVHPHPTPHRYTHTQTHTHTQMQK